MFKKNKNPKLFLPLFLVIFSFLVYWFTKPPSILYIDSGTMIAASYTLGIPNPPGFPLYMMASHVFSILPIFNVLTRLELFTIVFSVLALFLTYKIILMLLESDLSFFKNSKSSDLASKLPKNAKYFAAFFGAISLAFSYEYWSQSQNTEAFIFTDFFLVLFMYIILWVEKKKNEANFGNLFFKVLVLLALLFGLAVGSNPTIGVLVPGVLLVMFLNRKYLNVHRLLISGFVFMVTGLVVYLYLPIRAQSWPFVNWGNPQTLNLFLGHLRGAGLNIYEPETNSINGFTGSPVIFIQTISRFFYLLILQFTPFLLPLIFFGIRFVFKINKYLLVFLISVIFVDVIYSGLYFSGNQEAWFIPSWIITAIFSGIGFYYIYLNFKNSNLTKVLLLISLLPLLFWFIQLNRSGHLYTSDYAHNLYSTLDKNAILIGTGDFTNSLGYYLHEADKFRPDVTPITSNTFYINKWYRDDYRNATNVIISNDLENIIRYKSYDEFNLAMNKLIGDNIDKRPIYVTHLTLRGSAYAGSGSGQGLLTLSPDFKFIPHGLSLQVVKSSGTKKPDMKSFEYRFSNNNFPKILPFYLEHNYIAGITNIRNDYAYGYEALGDWYFDKGDFKESFKYYSKANEFNPNNSEIFARLGLYYKAIKEYNIASQYFARVLELTPKDVITRFNLASSLKLSGKKDEAIQQYQTIENMYPQEQIAAQARQEELKIRGAERFIDSKKIYYKNERLNLSFSYPSNWKLEEKDNGAVFLTNQQAGDDALDLLFYGQTNDSSKSINEIALKSPISPKGKILQTVDLKLAGFNAFVEVLESSDGLSQLIFISKNDWTWFISLNPGTSTNAQDFYDMLNSFKNLY